MAFSLNACESDPVAVSEPVGTASIKPLDATPQNPQTFAGLGYHP